MWPELAKQPSGPVIPQTGAPVVRGRQERLAVRVNVDGVDVGRVPHEHSHLPHREQCIGEAANRFPHDGALGYPPPRGQAGQRDENSRAGVAGARLVSRDLGEVSRLARQRLISLYEGHGGQAERDRGDEKGGHHEPLLPPLDAVAAGLDEFAMEIGRRLHRLRLRSQP
jgi:hypothetical protein